MRLGGLLSLALVGMIALAGCASNKVDEAADLPLDGAIPIVNQISWGLNECQIAVALIGVPASQVQPLVPEGFVVLSPAQVVAREGGAPALPPNPNEDGNFGLEMFTCTSGIGLDGAIENVQYGSLFTAVAVPAEFAVEGTKHGFVKWDVLIQDQPRREWLQAAGAKAVDGSAAFSSYDATGPTFRFAGDLVLGEDAYAFTGNGVAPLPEDGSFIEYSPATTGLVAWYTKYTWIDGTYGTVDVTVPSTGLASEVLGAGPHSGAGFVGIASFVDGTISLPGAEMEMGHGH